ncbi:MAG: heparinase [Candidatus Hydrogenedens sp.]|nr:heparinase II/III family protein [Candidatus Hydrogenedentota bacterium]NLF59429.1 heparinase [Candidatus Hydrogenedens sp.]
MKKQGTPFLRAGVVFAAVAALFCCAAGHASGNAAAVAAQVTAAVPHPRLLMSAVEAARLRENIPRDETAAALFSRLQAESEALLEQPTVVYQKEGKRLLSVSREVLRRVLFLSFVYRMTDDARFAERAVVEMESAAAYSDWNPPHFLDTAEMAAALAIGYDWLYPLLSPEQEAVIRGAILEKGIAPSFAGHDRWAKGDNNWNQVCHAGMVMGALAVVEREPGLAVRVITRALDGLPFAMKTYRPDGIYLEGPGYWEYGTTYNVMLLDALKTALGTDFGLSGAEGFRQTGAFPLYMTGPTGLHFNFSDCGQRGGPFAAVYWFARKWKEPGITWLDEWWLKKTLAGASNPQGRFLPLLLLWRDGMPAVTEPANPLHWRGAGTNPVAVHRSSWTEPDAVFLAAKAGTPFANHGHMDTGTFVLDADGVRWSVDLGAEGYHPLEARGMDIWGRTQQSVRWDVFRYNNSSHSTLTVNGEKQRVNASGTIVRFSDREEFPHTVMDLGPVYAGQLSAARRGFALLPDRRVLIQDEVTAGEGAARVRWAMTTPAEVTGPAPGRALLEQSGKQMLFEVLSPAGTAVETFSTDPPNEWDSPNPGKRQVGFHVDLEPGASATLTVLLTPGTVMASAATPPMLRPLAEWDPAEPTGNSE